MGHGVRAVVSPTMAPAIAAGHVAGWIGVGGPGQGPNGETMWLQTGIASVPGMGTLVYAEITRPGRHPQFVSLVENVEPQQSFRLAVLEMAHRPSHLAGLAERPPGDEADPPSGLDEPVAADRDGGVLRRQDERLQHVRLPLRERRRSRRDAAAPGRPSGPASRSSTEATACER